ncbi:hypothetical protein EVAR_15090_1 [Eumeta japonica]|uniref:Uncharacterized protein n=1 Tax=Eumeta variegata TaxID=151549 RepID=A0A4C1UI42_EUMVA|nr:hypothetical protein EVAR_15090_1 [Eumeta japonica]
MYTYKAILACLNRSFVGWRRPVTGNSPAHLHSDMESLITLWNPLTSFVPPRLTFLTLFLLIARPTEQNINIFYFTIQKFELHESQQAKQMSNAAHDDAPPASRCASPQSGRVSGLRGGPRYNICSYGFGKSISSRLSREKRTQYLYILHAGGFTS